MKKLEIIGQSEGRLPNKAKQSLFAHRHESLYNKLMATRSSPGDLTGDTLKRADSSAAIARNSRASVAPEMLISEIDRGPKTNMKGKGQCMLRSLPVPTSRTGRASVKDIVRARHGDTSTATSPPPRADEKARRASLNFGIEGIVNVGHTMNRATGQRGSVFSVRGDIEDIAHSKDGRASRASSEKILVAPRKALEIRVQSLA